MICEEDITVHEYKRGWKEERVQLNRGESKEKL